MFGSQIWFNSANALSAAACSGDLISTSNLQVYYKMDGDATDSSGNGNDGTPTGVTYTDSKNANFGSASVFSTTGTYLTGNAADYGIADNYTVSAWIKIANSQTWGQQIWSDDRVGVDRVWQLRADNTSNGGTLTFIRFDAADAVATVLTSTSSICDDAWHHIAATFDSAVGSKLFIDGAQVADDSVLTANNDPATTTPLISNTGATKYLIGNVDEATLWNRTLDNSEIATLAGGTCPLKA